MKYLSICSGIEAATTAWHPLGWQPLAFAEIEPFPSAVLAHHWPDVPNLGDMTNYGNWPSLRPELIVGGTPCQAFSVAGLRRGLADARGNLTLTFCEMADHFDPEWIVWENVPGVLSSKDNAFGCFLAGLCGAGDPLLPVGRWANAGVVSGPKRTVAWRVLDAQFFGVAQRRRRVFVVAVRGPGNWRSAAALFPVADGLCWDSPPSREAREKEAREKEAREKTAGYLTAGSRNGVPGPDDAQQQRLICMAHEQGGAEICFDRGPTLTCNHEAPILAHTLRGEGFDASEDGTGRGTPLVPVAFDTTQITSAANYSNPKPGDPCHPLAAGAHPPANAFCHPLAAGAHPPAIAFSCKDSGADAGELAPTLRSMGHHGSHANAGGQVAIAFPAQMSGTQCAAAEDLAPVLQAKNPTAVATFQQSSQAGKGTIGYDSSGIAKPCKTQPDGQMIHAVRRLTPRECERLQGFPDDHTRIPNWNGWRKLSDNETPEECRAQGLEVRQTKKSGKWRVKDVDGPRYKALGNSMAVPVMRWIGERITLISTIQ